MGKTQNWLFVITIVLTSTSVAWAVSEQVLHNFPAFLGDGSQPESPLVLDSKGNLFGTTYVGGANDAGTVFELSPVQGGGWNYCLIHSFASSNGMGGPSYSRLVIDALGNLYGTTLASTEGVQGTGMVFELSPPVGGGCTGWTETILHTFPASINGDGMFPVGGVVLDSQGDLIGTTIQGGSAGGGIVFELLRSQGWKEIIIHNFQGSSHGDGAGPRGNLAVDGKGRIYGFTPSTNVYQLTQNPKTLKWSYHQIYYFTDTPTLQPIGGIALDSNGHLFGTSNGGSDPHDLATVFELMKVSGVWKVKFLHGFQGGAGGRSPAGGVTVDSANRTLYGGTCDGGTNSLGLVYSLAIGGTFDPVYSFVGPPADGQCPYSSEPVLDPAGHLHGTTFEGGLYGGGTVYEITQ